MTKYVLWLIAWTPAFFALGQFFVEQPLLSPLGSGLVLLVTGLLSGLRISADSASAYMKDLQRKNNFLAELSADLAEHNHIFLKLVLSDNEPESSDDAPSQAEEE